MFDMAKLAGHIKGVMAHFIHVGVGGGGLQVQYADNTILLFEPNQHSIRRC